jgi:hypothetical protein
MLNLTQSTGIICFGAATLACGIAFSCLRNNFTAPFKSFWATCTGLHFLMTLEVYFSSRHWVAGITRLWLRDKGLYSERVFIQVLAVCLTLCLISVIFVRAKKSLKRFGVAEKICLNATLAAVLTFCIELPSIHALDRYLYADIYGLYLIGYLWSSLACIALLGAAVRVLHLPH